MTALVLVADGAYPQPDYAFLPAAVSWWLGYLGGQTPHAWTAAEVAALEATGRSWGGIWTAPQTGPYSRAQAVTDAHAAIAAAAAIGYPTDRPMLLDVESSVWQANPTMTEDAAGYWCQIVMASRGARAAWYGPCQSNAGWRACWTGQPPTLLPTGVVGIQYDHALAGDRYDVSLFDPAFLTGGNVSATGPASWDDNDWQAFRSQVAETGVNTGDELLQAVRNAEQNSAAALAAVKALGTVQTLNGNFTISGSGTVKGN